MASRTALLAGATGLIGSQLLPLLLASDRYARVIVVGRNPVQLTHSKLVNQVVNFDDLNSSAAALKADDIFCCLGTTIRQAGSREAFRKVDVEYPLALARVTHQLGARQYSIVTAMGSKKDSPFFYNRVKAEVEDAVSVISFNSIHIYRPSLLIGPRKNRRYGELVGAIFGLILSPVIPKRHRPIASSRVARAMLDFASRDEGGIYFHPSDALRAFPR